MPSTTLPLPLGDLGTALTLLTMRGMVGIEYLLPIVRLTAADIVAGLDGKDGREQALAIREWLDVHVEFLRDPENVEMLHGPAWQIKQILRGPGIVQVDCDDVAMLGAALGKAIGLRARFVVVGFAPNKPFRHVWSELSPRGNEAWIDMDVTRPVQGLPTNRIRRAFTMNV